MSHSSTLAGAFPVIPTPFDENGKIATECLRNVIDYLVGAGADGVVFPGLASEYSDLTREERLATTAFIGRVLDGRIPFMVGAGSPTPEQSIEFSIAGAEAGAVCAMVMAPHQLANDEAGMVEFFEKLARQAKIPIMLQNAPPPMGAGLAADTIGRILERVPEIHYVKEETVPCGQRMEEILRKRVGSLKGVFGGAGGRHIIDELNRGALGTLPASELCDMHVMLTRAYARKDLATARDLFVRMLPILNLQAVFRCSLTKEVLRLRGIIKSSFVRAAGPVMDASDISELHAFWRLVEEYMGPLQAMRDRAAIVG
jgi:dihydrodipicolinate synthase/N-acetylneuraminate lyase